MWGRTKFQNLPGQYTEMFRFELLQMQRTLNEKCYGSRRWESQKNIKHTDSSLFWCIMSTQTLQCDTVRKMQGRMELFEPGTSK
jgi:hypothetical protein